MKTPHWPIAFLFLGLLTVPCAGQRQHTTGASHPIQGLGVTSFATSTQSPEAQTAFLRGLLLLHLFEYSDAANSFVAAQKLDPAFAMAYWGEAMTSNLGVWKEVDAKAGKTALDKFAPTAAARQARIADPREKAYFAAVELLYDGAGTKAERDQRYAAAMQKLAAAYPEDRNAQLFYSLALLSQSEGVRDVPVYLQAAAIAQAIFRLEPQNPGAAHYWIHGMDDPAHAAGALEAARALSKIAPDAPHAQHMCSHIFMALGMWDDVVAANIEAMRVSVLHDQAAGFPPYNCGHYMDWLEYGYFQQGRFRAAEQSVRDCATTGQDVTRWVAAHPGQAPYGSKNSARLQSFLLEALAVMQDTAVIESQDWNFHSALDLSTLKPHATAWSDFTNGLAATQSGKLDTARSALDALRAKTEAYRAGHDPDPEELQSLAVATSELSGLLQIKSGNFPAGAAEIRHAADAYRAMAFAFGPPVTIKPPEELLGEVLLANGDPAGARHAFAQALERAPGRTQSLLGRARAEHLAGDEASARKTYQTLLEIWHAADPDLPALAEARLFTGGAPKPPATDPK